MSNRLLERINELRTKEGDVALKTRLCQAIGKSERTLLLWLQKGVPSAEGAYKLALACGFARGEALSIAKECFSSRAKKSA